LCALSNAGLCPYHENVKLLLQVINKNISEVSKTFHDFDSTVCNQAGDDGMLSKCANVCLREKYSLNNELLKKRVK
jgi:hypothetical protein